MFGLNPEAAHDFALKAIVRGVARGAKFTDPRLRQLLFGVNFPNPLGLAAGFDKNALAIQRWASFGFGFAEIGTATLKPQPGNPRPRLFRLPEDEGLINRMGFNNDGAVDIARRVGLKPASIPIGVNIGKNKDVPAEEAAKDYAECFRYFRRFGAYTVVNVSSPNTPGLRALQEKGPLLDIIGAIREVDKEKPLFVKIAPDLEPTALQELIQVAHEAKLTGIIATNTTISREHLARPFPEPGGLSGRPLRIRAHLMMRDLYKSCDKDLILIGVGGIMDGKDLYDRIAAGAHLCQAYTGFVYGGPHFAAAVLRDLVRQMEENQIPSLAALRGSAVTGD